MSVGRHARLRLAALRALSATNRGEGLPRAAATAADGRPSPSSPSPRAPSPGPSPQPGARGEAEAKGRRARSPLLVISSRRWGWPITRPARPI